MSATFSVASALTKAVLDPLVWGVVAFAGVGAFYLAKCHLLMLRERAALTHQQFKVQVAGDLASAAPDSFFSRLVGRYPIEAGRAPDRDLTLDEFDANLNRHDGVIRFLVGGLTILGLLLTFLGMLETLGVSANLISMLQGQAGTEVGPAFQRLIAGLQEVLAGMISAFSRTIVALVLSLALGLWHSVLTRGKAKLFFDAAEFLDRTFLPFYSQRSGGATTLPALLKQLDSTTEQGFRNLNEAFKTHADINTQAASRLETAFLQRSADETKHQHHLDMVTRELNQTLEGLSQVIQRHTEFSSELVQAIMAVDPRGRQMSHFEDLKNLFAGVHMAVQRQTTDAEEQTARLEASHRENTQRIIEQSDVMRQVVTSLQTASPYLPLLTQIDATARESLQLSERQLVVFSELTRRLGEAKDARPEVVQQNSLELMREQNRLLRQLIKATERPWWATIGDFLRGNQRATQSPSRGRSGTDQLSSSRSVLEQNVKHEQMVDAKKHEEKLPHVEAGGQ